MTLSFAVHPLTEVCPAIREALQTFTLKRRHTSYTVPAPQGIVQVQALPAIAFGLQCSIDTCVFRAVAAVHRSNVGHDQRRIIRNAALMVSRLCRRYLALPVTPCVVNHGRPINGVQRIALFCFPALAVAPGRIGAVNTVSLNTEHSRVKMTSVCAEGRSLLIYEANRSRLF